MTHPGPSHWSPDDLRRRLNESAISYTFTRSGGPGGQNVNKVNTRVTLWFDLEGCSDLTAEEKSTIRRRLAGRISRDGRMHIVSSRHRTQSANRAVAMDRFFCLLAEALRPRKRRKPTRAPRSAAIRRLRAKRRTGETKRIRGRAAEGEED